MSIDANADVAELRCPNCGADLREDGFLILTPEWVSRTYVFAEGEEDPYAVMQLMDREYCESGVEMLDIRAQCGSCFKDITDQDLVDCLDTLAQRAEECY